MKFHHIQAQSLTVDPADVMHHRVIQQSQSKHHNNHNLDLSMESTASQINHDLEMDHVINNEQPVMIIWIFQSLNYIQINKHEINEKFTDFMIHIFNSDQDQLMHIILVS